MRQQDQTHRFFQTNASAWQHVAEANSYSVIENRTLTVLETMKRFRPGSSLLDVGCGTGQLAVEASRNGWEVTGLDFSKEMIQIARDNCVSHETSVEFICSSIFDVDLKERSFDIVSAQGFIEYISLEQLDSFLRICYEVLKDDGVLALGSRNRLFNILSFNEYTELEIDIDTIHDLLHESIILQSSESQQDAINTLRNLQRTYPQPAQRVTTTIDVDIRYQFSPAELLHRVEQHGFKVLTLMPVHYHSMPVSLLHNQGVDEAHREVATFISRNFISLQQCVPYSSSFLLEARRV